MLEEIDDLISMMLPDQADNFYYSLGEWHNLGNLKKLNINLRFEDDYGKKASWDLIILHDLSQGSLEVLIPDDSLKDFTAFKRHIGPDGNWNYFDVYDFE